MTDVPQAIVFDLDGTLADTAADIRRALNCVLAAHDIRPLDLETVKLMIGSGPKVLLERALDKSDIQADTEQVECMTTEFHDAYQQQGHALSKLFTGAEECLERLSLSDISIGLCSNKPEQLCHQLLTELGILRYFSAIQGFGAGLARKPDPAVLRSTLDILGVRPAHALYVGDSETDVLTARAAGVPVALVSHGYTAVPVTELGADWIVDSMTEIPSICTRSPRAAKPPGNRQLRRSTVP